MNKTNVINTKIKWHRCAVDKKAMSGLMTKSNLRGFLQMGTHLGLVLITGTLAYYSFIHFPWYVTVLAVYLHGTVYSFLNFTGAGHELSHKTVFKSPRVNEFFMKLTSFLSWNDYIGFRASHIRHHQSTTHTGLDYEVILPSGRVTRIVDWFKIWVINPDAIIGTFKGKWNHACGRLNSPWEEMILPADNLKLRRQHRNWARFQIAGHLVLAILFITFHQYFLLVLVTFAPFYAGGLNFLCTHSQHTGLSPDVEDFRLCCRTIIMSSITSYLYWKMNYHIEHHMYPAVPFYNLSKLRNHIEEELPPANKGLLDAWREIFGIWKRQEKEPAYCYIPPIPDIPKKNDEEISGEDLVLS